MNAGNWIKSPVDKGAASVSFETTIKPEKALKSATLSVSAIGLFEAQLNGKKLGCGVLTPGYTAYQAGVQYFT